MEKQWYVFRVRQSNIPELKKKLDFAGIENFIPFRTEKVIDSGGHLRDRTLPLALNYIFVRCNIRDFDFSRFNCPVYPCYDPLTRTNMVVPERQMKDFIFIHDFSASAILLSNDNLRRGDRVRIVRGEFAGVVGELVRIQGHKRVVVRLEGLFSLAVNTYIPKSYLEPLV